MSSETTPKNTSEPSVSATTEPTQYSAVVPLDKAGSRLDQVAAELFPDYSRSRITEWIKGGKLLYEGETVKPKVKVVGGEHLELSVAPEPQGDWVPQDIPFDVVYEDDTIIVVSKPAGLVVHPASGNWEGTLLNGLLFRYPELSSVPRAGIVHRLDKDTTGLMVVARTIEAQTHLVTQLQNRSVNREYRALVHGSLASEAQKPGTANREYLVDAPMGRHPGVRTKMAVVAQGGKPAITRYRCLAQFDGYALLGLKLETGRTHQIRVHMAHLGYPLLGDQTYGKRLSQAQLKQNSALLPIVEFERQALHALKLGLIHPKTGEYREWESALAEDFDQLRQHLDAHF